MVNLHLPYIFKDMQRRSMYFQTKRNDCRLYKKKSQYSFKRISLDQSTDDVYPVRNSLCSYDRIYYCASRKPKQPVALFIIVKTKAAASKRPGRQLHAATTICKAASPGRGPSVRLQNLPWSKTGLVSRQVLHPLSKLQNWIRSKTGRYKTGLVSNTKIGASLRGTKHKPWQSNLTSDTVEIFIQDQFSSQTGFASSIEATKLD